MQQISSPLTCLLHAQPPAVAGAATQAPATKAMVAPVSGPSEVGMMRSEIKQGQFTFDTRVVLCKEVMHDIAALVHVL